MKKLGLGCIMLVTACGAESAGTAATDSITLDTAEQALEMLENGDRSAMQDCDAVAAKCAESDKLAEHCDAIAEHCEAFGEFLVSSSHPAKACWQSCSEEGCESDECSAKSERHSQGRGHGMKCVENLDSCVDDPEGCEAACGDLEFKGPFSRRGGEGARGGFGKGHSDAGAPDFGGGRGFGGELGEKPEFDGERPEFDGEKPELDGERPDFGGEKPEFDGERPEFDGKKPEFDGERPDFGGEKPEFDGERPEFDGEKPEFDGERPDFGGEKPEFDGERPEFDGEKPELDGERPDFAGHGDAGAPRGFRR